MKKEVHTPVNKSKRFPVWLGTCTLHTVIRPTHKYKSTLKQEERTSLTLIGFTSSTLATNMPRNRAAIELVSFQ